jgi:hypothetical protein
MNAIDRLNAINDGWTPEPIIPIEEQVFKTVLENGDVFFRNSKGQFHSVNDEPAYIDTFGSQFWYKNGELHREGNKPVAIYADGSELFL